MAVLQGRSRQELRVAVGQNLGAFRSGVATASGSATTLVDASLGGGNDDFNGWWLLLTSGANDGRIRQVSDYVASSGTVTVRATNTALSGTAQADTYELWEPPYNPARIHEYFITAAMAATGKFFDPVEDISLYADAKTQRFDIPTGLAMLNRIDYRHGVPTKIIHECERVFDETVDTDFVQSLDTELRKAGSSSLKIVVTGDAEDVITDSFTAVDLSAMTHLEGWIRCSVTAAAGALIIHLDDGTVQADGTDRESLNVPALVADTWTYFRVALTNWTDLTAIVSVGLEYKVDIGDCTIWLDDLKCVNQDEARWDTLHRHHWFIDKESRDLVLRLSGKSIAGYHLLKLVGGKVPALLSGGETSSDEAAVTEIPDDFMIARATGLALSAHSNRDGADTQAKKGSAGFWMGESNRALRRMPFIVNGRAVQ